MKPTDQQKIVAAMAIGYECRKDERNRYCIFQKNLKKRGPEDIQKSYWMTSEGEAWDHAILNDDDYVADFDHHISEMWEWLAERASVSVKSTYNHVQCLETTIKILIGMDIPFTATADTLADALILAICRVEGQGKE